MNKGLCLNLIERYRKTAPPAEHPSLTNLYSFITENPHCFQRNHEEGAIHIAASVLLIEPEGGQGLFLWHKKIQRWTQPGGHADGDPDLHRVARKELEEEIGITNAEFADLVPLDIHLFDYPREIYGYQKQIYNFCFLAIKPSGQEPIIKEPDKCSGLRWASPNEAREMIKDVYHEGTEGLIWKWEQWMEKFFTSKKRD